MNILVTVDENYIEQLQIMLFSLKRSNPKTEFQIYLANRKLTDMHIQLIKKYLEDEQMKIIDVKLPFNYENAVVTDRYPEEMYDRLIAVHYLPETVHRILYLDPDIIVKGDLNELYNSDFEGKLFGGATHIRSFLKRLNELRLGIEHCDIYVNTGVLLINAELLRKIQDMNEILHSINNCKKILLLPDQDIITMIYGRQIKEIDGFRYNLSDRTFQMASKQLIPEKAIDIKWVEEHTAIIHYCGKNKPWKKNYHGVLGEYYIKYKEEYEKYKNKL